VWSLLDSSRNLFRPVLQFQYSHSSIVVNMSQRSEAIGFLILHLFLSFNYLNQENTWVLDCICSLNCAVNLWKISVASTPSQARYFISMHFIVERCTGCSNFMITTDKLVGSVEWLALPTPNDPIQVYKKHKPLSTNHRYSGTKILFIFNFLLYFRSFLSCAEYVLCKIWFYVWLVDGFWRYNECIKANNQPYTKLYFAEHIRSTEHKYIYIQTNLKILHKAQKVPKSKTL